MTVNHVSVLPIDNKVTLRTLSNTVFATLFALSILLISTLAGANEALSSDSISKRISSIAVDYNGHPQKVAQGKYQAQKNEAQQAAVDTINSDEEFRYKDAIERRTRDEMIALRKNKLVAKTEAINKPNLHLSKQTSAVDHYLEFDIYSASVALFDDIDYDGFYQTFSVTFDADVYGPYSGQRTQVFADLYLSRDGGPWELYFTTDAFTIIDDNSEDEFEVLTTLDAGYRTQHYDVLIDLYEVGYSDIVATISSEQVDSLYALPLESADRDVYEEVVSTSVAISAGSASIISLVLIGLVLLGRFLNVALIQKGKKSPEYRDVYWQ